MLPMGQANGKPHIQRDGRLYIYTVQIERFSTNLNNLHRCYVITVVILVFKNLGLDYCILTVKSLLHRY